MWITISSGILGFSFIFGNSIRNVFESVLTLFVIHPFDVGDTIYIDGAYCVVEEASLNKACSNPRPFSIIRVHIQTRCHAQPRKTQSRQSLGPLGRKRQLR